MPRRGENIRKRKDGRWEGRYRIRNLADGTTCIRSVYAKSYAEAKEKLAEAKWNIQQAIDEKDISVKKCTEGKICFQQAAAEWLLETEKSKKYSTYVKYRKVYQKYLKPVLDDCRIDELNEKKIRETLLLQAERADTLSDSLTKSIYCVLNQIFIYTEEYYDIKIEKIQRRKRCTASPKAAEVLNHTEQSRLFQYLYRDMDVEKLGVILCVSTGLRLGEICALKWSDIDLKEKVLHVNSTIQRISVDGQKTKTVLLESEPKSISSKREIPISEALTALLLPFYGNGYMLNQNKPMEPRTYQKKFKKYLREAGIEQKRFHSLRHTFATNCIASGADVKSLSEILGHANVNITLNRYVHPTMEAKRQYLNSLSSIYGQYVGQQYF